MTDAPPTQTPQAGMITIDQASRLIMVSDERIRQLVKAGYIPKAARNTYPLVGVVQGYIRSLKDEQKSGSRAERENKVRDVRAEEIAIRIEEKRRKLIPIEDATAVMDHWLAVVVRELIGLPARVTRDVPLRGVIEKELDASRNRMASALRTSAATLREGGALPGDTPEDDAGPVGAGEPKLPVKRGRPRSS